ncbi:unnamed protein product [Ambrosiozyma monospora]|uniref:Unnamed protein product n=1 Tax=Ambrosiozyma monospora TaxID=43982 RepID=A0ACB5SY84_AMBMO|nr:unnamed protein product [Ambrosiozyma monospora]
MHRFSNILEEQPGVYDFYIERYTCLLSMIRKVPEVGQYLSEKEVIRHCLKNFLASRHTKPATKLLQLRGVNLQSFHRFSDMMEELVEAIQRTEKEKQRQIILQKHQAQMNLIPKFPAPAPAKIPVHVQTPARNPAHAQVPAGNPVHAQASARTPVHAQTPAKLPAHVPAKLPAKSKVSVPEKVTANKKQESQSTKAHVPKKIESNKKPKHKSTSPKTRHSNRKESEYSAENQVASNIRKILKDASKKQQLARSDTFKLNRAAIAGKQPLAPVHVIDETIRDEAKKTSGVPTHVISWFTDPDEARVGSSSGWTAETLYCCTPQYRARALLGCL